MRLLAGVCGCDPGELHGVWGPVLAGDAAGDLFGAVARDRGDVLGGVAPGIIGQRGCVFPVQLPVIIWPRSG
jgi:hypothetical protein